VEPASAAGVAGLVAKCSVGDLDSGQTIAVTVTGHGLKDVDTALDFAGTPPDVVIDPDAGQAAEAAGLRDG
jgi:threonine synthase